MSVKDKMELENNNARLSDTVSASYYETKHVADYVDSLKSIWADALGMDASKIQTNLTFFEQGGYSLLAIQIVDHINQELNVNVSPTTVLEHSSIDELSVFLHKLVESKNDTSDTGFSKNIIEQDMLDVDETKSFQMTELQQAYWIGEKSIYSLGTPATWFTEYESESIDSQKLLAAINRLIEIHPMLRAVYTDNAEQQILESVTSFPLVEIDLNECTDEDYFITLEKQRSRVKQGQGDLSIWPLFEISIIHSKNRKSKILLGGRLIILDGRSGEIFARDLYNLYLGKSIIAPRITFPAYLNYFNKSNSTQDTQVSQKSASSKKYWLDRIPELPAAPELPKYPGQIRSIGPMKRRVHRLSASYWKLLQKMAGTIGVTPTVALCGAYSLILSKWSSTSEFTINMMYGKRQPIHPDVNNVIGNFSDTILLEFCKKENFTKTLQALQKQLFNDLEHGNFSGISMIRELSRYRDASDNNPLMPYVFASGLGMAQGTEDHDDKFFMEKFGWKAIDSGIQTPQVLLDHQVIESDGELVIQWDSRDDAFPTGMIDSMFSCYIDLLEELSKNDDEFWKYPKMTLKEQKAYRYAVNSVPPHPQWKQLLHQEFLNQVELNPNKLALICSEGKFTYKEVYEKAKIIASQLIKKGITAGEPVIIHYEKSFDQIVTCLGILMSGGAYVPVSTDQPKARIEQILAACKPRFAIVSKVVSTQSVYKDNAVELLDTRSTSNEIVLPAINKLNTSSVAYIIYTSGSTGTPKGVTITHEAAINTILDVNARFGVTEDDVAIAVSELSFDLSVYDIFGLFQAGGTLVMPDHEHSRNPIHLCQLVEEYQVTVWNSVPAYVEMMVEYVNLRGLNSLKSLKKIMMSGDWIPIGLPKKIKSTSPNALVISMGGATEASIWSNFHIIEELSLDWASIPYGVPLAGQSFYVLDEDMHDSPDWVQGELYIGGNGVALGYYGDTEKTNAQFVKHPVSGERIYRTGDWGRYRPGGILEFLGRKDGQIKLRGHRVEIGEIEAVLNKFNDIRDSVVVPTGKGNDIRLVAFVVLNSGGSIESVKKSAKDSLPNYMIPSLFQQLESMPLTANGKVNRKLLSEKKYVIAPVKEATKVIETIHIKNEKVIKQIWCDLLAINDISPDMRFFELGGNSITAIRMISKIENDLGINLSLDIVHKNPTIRELAVHIESASSAREPILAIKLGNELEREVVFCPHPVGGNIFCYWELQKNLPYNVVGIQSRGVVPSHEPHSTVAEMGRAYLDSIRDHLPIGTVKFIGWSMGGLISLEIARLLEQEGRKCKVVLLDTWVALENTSLNENDSLNSFFFDLSGGRVRDLGEKISGLDLKSALTVGFKALVEQAIIGREMTEDVINRLYNVFRKNSQAIHIQKPTQNNAEVLLFKSTIRDEKRFSDLKPFNEDEEWCSSCSSLIVEEFVGDHFDIVSRIGLKNLRDRIVGYLENVQP